MQTFFSRVPDQPAHAHTHSSLPANPSAHNTPQTCPPPCHPLPQPLAHCTAPCCLPLAYVCLLGAGYLLRHTHRLAHLPANLAGLACCILPLPAHSAPLSAATCRRLCWFLPPAHFTHPHTHLCPFHPLHICTHPCLLPLHCVWFPASHWRPDLHGGCCHSRCIQKCCLWVLARPFSAPTGLDSLLPRAASKLQSCTCLPACRCGEAGAAPGHRLLAVTLDQ